jgi:ribonuclease Z
MPTRFLPAAPAGGRFLGAAAAAIIAPARSDREEIFRLSGFELLFLGTSAAVPARDRGLSALLVACGRERLLVDCGEGTQRQLMRAGAGFRGLRAVLLTHAHLDHVLGLAGLIATLDLSAGPPAIDILGSEETIAFVRDYLAVTVGPERADSSYRLAAVAPGRVLTRKGWHVDAFAVRHRGTQSLGWRFSGESHRPLLPDRLAALGVPEGLQRAALARGEAVVLADGRRVTPEMVRGPDAPGTVLAVVGDCEETDSLDAAVAGANALVIEATFLERDIALARARGHLCAADSGRLARRAGVGELLLTHLSGRYSAAEIAAEAAREFPQVRTVADFDRFTIDRSGVSVDNRPIKATERGRQ